MAKSLYLPTLNDATKYIVQNYDRSAMSVFTVVVILVTLLLINDHQTVTSFTRYIITYNSYTSRPNIHEPLYTVQIQALLSTTETATRSHWTNNHKDSTCISSIPAYLLFLSKDMHVTSALMLRPI